ncbi:MAG: 23S rRNA (cytidine(2498)-2'-O)-methyltransferase RlmM [Methylohalobius sp.]|nr:23S rRNA (cytidine(2498)-2'-O)-methyltransferase RlmM [Methylohalobius sp.]
MRAKTSKIQPPGLIGLCRPGFERELAKELTRMALGAVQAEQNSAFVVLTADQPVSRFARERVPAWQNLIFARQVWPWFARLEDLPRHDRLEPILAALDELAAAGGYRAVVLEFPDSQIGRPLAKLCRTFAQPLTEALKARGYLVEGAGLELRLLFGTSTTVWLGEVPCGLACPWPGGIVRLKLPREAPSRSVLKLVEAFKVLLNEEERARFLKPGMSAVDLGAAPGGWSWQLAKWGLRVTAVDNARLAKSVLATGLIEHVVADGFKWRPPKAVDWLLCDMIERPQLVIELVGKWLSRRWCRHAMFNLKLPMKNRLETVDTAVARLRLSAKEVRVKHLYHDREEVTVYAQA